MHELFEPKNVRSAAVAWVALIIGIVALSCGGSSTTAPTEDASGGFVFDDDGKIAVCHYQQDIGTWTLVKLSLEATLEHLAKHDDALPGGLTAITKTRLDESCKKVPS